MNMPRYQVCECVRAWACVCVELWGPRRCSTKAFEISWASGLGCMTDRWHVLYVYDSSTLYLE